MILADTPVIDATAPGQKPAPPQPKTFPNERAELEAAFPKFLAAADAYPDTTAGIAARYHAAATLDLSDGRRRPGSAMRRSSIVMGQAWTARWPSWGRPS